MAEIVSLSALYSARARDVRKLAYAANAAGRFDVADSLMKRSRNLEMSAGYSRVHPTLVVRLPEYSGTSFSIDNGGAA